MRRSGAARRGSADHARRPRELGRHYLGGRDPKTPLASPLHLDLAGLEPLYVQVGTAQVLLHDAHRLVANAKKAGVEITLDARDGLFHVFQLYPVLPEAAEAVEKIGAFVRAKTG